MNDLISYLKEKDYKEMNIKVNKGLKELNVNIYTNKVYILFR